MDYTEISFIFSPKFDKFYFFSYNRENFKGLDTLYEGQNLQGKVWKFGDNIDTDLIIAARYLNTSDASELAKYVMEDADPAFVSKMNPGDIIVAGENFGCGSSREHAPIALKEAGVASVIAPTFARIFYRNAFNMGLPIFELPEAAEIEEGDTVRVDMDAGEIINVSQAKTYKFTPIPEFMQELVDAGGLIEFAKQEIANKEK
ncbi:MAG: 3-isopropylmalate dehydratase small subunit [Epsilonproteobacteria bacterium]|nr:3-isopropylmalate dehydratase small subunit [Campylobacterota bacterium]